MPWQLRTCVPHPCLPASPECRSARRETSQPYPGEAGRQRCSQMLLASRLCLALRLCLAPRLCLVCLPYLPGLPGLPRFSDSTGLTRLTRLTGTSGFCYGSSPALFSHAGLPDAARCTGPRIFVGSAQN